MKTTWDFKEELKPCGTDCLTTDYLKYNKSTDLSGIMAIKVESHPWFIIIWEKLPVMAPPMEGINNPFAIGTKPYCCYLNTVIFYKYPYRTREGEKPPCSFDEWDKCETRMSIDDTVTFNNDDFKLGSGTVVFAEGYYWMRWWARSKSKTKS